MNATHTPGPWTARTAIDVMSPSLPERWEVLHERLDGGARYICHTFGYDAQARAESEANARLIAAAPAMLAALEALTLDVQGWHEAHGRIGQYSDPTSDYLAQAMIAARAAIALARGA